MTSGITFALVTRTAWGVWLVLADFASQYTVPILAAAITDAVSAALAIGYVVITETSVVMTRNAWAFSIAAGVTAAAGLVWLTIALVRGSTATVSTVSALYFVVAAVVGIVLLEKPISLTKVAGVGIAIRSIALIAQLIFDGNPASRRSRNPRGVIGSLGHAECRAHIQQ